MVGEVQEEGCVEPKVLLHIGPHKTGTTYIQQQFVAHRDRILAAGWLYPDLGRPERQAGHHDLAHAHHKYLGQFEGSQAEKIRELPKSGKNLVLSAEGFCMWGEEKFRRLRELLGAEVVELVYYVRDPYDVFYSYWKEEVKQGITTSLPEKFITHFANPFRSRLLNPLVDLNRYRRFGSGFRLKVMPYDQMVSRRLDIFQALASTSMGISEEFEDRSGKPNASLSIEATEVLRLMTEDFFSTHGIKGKAVRFALYDLDIKDVSRKIAEAFERGLVHKKKMIKLDRNARTFVTIERQVLTAFGDDFLVRPEGDELFSRESESMAYYDKWDVLTDPPVRELYGDLRTMISQKLEADERFVRGSQVL